jgi:hypothetical protein
VSALRDDRETVREDQDADDNHQQARGDLDLDRVMVTTDLRERKRPIANRLTGSIYCGLF